MARCSWIQSTHASAPPWPDLREERCPEGVARIRKHDRTLSSQVIPLVHSFVASSFRHLSPTTSPCREDTATARLTHFSKITLVTLLHASNHIIVSRRKYCQSSVAGTKCLGEQRHQKKVAKPCQSTDSGNKCLGEQRHQKKLETSSVYCRRNQVLV